MGDIDVCETHKKTWPCPQNLFRKKPKKPGVQQVLNYKMDHECGLSTAKDALDIQYRSDLLEWIVDAIEHLLGQEDEPGLQVEEDEHATGCLCDQCTCAGCGERKHAGRCRRRG